MDAVSVKKDAIFLENASQGRNSYVQFKNLVFGVFYSKHFASGACGVSKVLFLGFLNNGILFVYLWLIFLSFFLFFF